MTDIPTVSYDDIASRFEADGVRLGDVHRSHEHFVAWHARNGLPDRDADGMEIGSSRIFMSMYDAAPDGRAQRPPYVNFWHWLLAVYDQIEWEETPQGRRRTVPLGRGMHQPRRRSPTRRRPRRSRACSAPPLSPRTCVGRSRSTCARTSPTWWSATTSA